MGMNKFQLLYKVQLPISLPIILNGIRISLVLTIGNTAVATLIGAGGLGKFIFQGLESTVEDLILLGALPIVIIAVIIDFLMQFLISIITPKGLE
jgi:osmoprotectant transport system permease protein